MATTPSLVSHEASDTAISQQVVEAIATAEGTSPLDLDRPLYDVIDPDALNALFSGQSRPVSVRFSYLGYEVVVQDDGTIDVTEKEQQTV